MTAYTDKNGDEIKDGDRVVFVTDYQRGFGRGFIPRGTFATIEYHEPIDSDAFIVLNVGDDWNPTARESNREILDCVERRLKKDSPEIQTVSLLLAFGELNVGTKMKCLIDSEWLLITDMSRIKVGYHSFNYQVIFENGYKTVFGCAEKLEIIYVEE